MERLKWYDPIWAAFMFFTRLPLWRWHEPPVDAFRRVVEWWPLVGWFSGAIMATVLYASSFVFPYPVAILLAIVARMLLTGALHEDGLADFFDGFGGGRGQRERILSIMKDSHIGSYGVLALALYLAILFFSLYSICCPLHAALVVLVADPYAKMLSAQFVSMLPYARTEETAKSHVVYRRLTVWAGICLAVQGLLPLAVFLWLVDKELSYWYPFVFVPALTMYFLYLYVKKRIQGYTGDCCGAVFLLSELSFVLVASVLFAGAAV